MVDDDDVVIFRRKLGGQGTANLAEADDHDSHANAPFLFFKAGTHVGATIGRPRSLIAALRSPIVSCMGSGRAMLAPTSTASGYASKTCTVLSPL